MDGMSGKKAFMESLSFGGCEGGRKALIHQLNFNGKDKVEVAIKDEGGKL